MSIHVCFAQGMADCLPNSQSYVTLGSADELAKYVAHAQKAFELEHEDGAHIHTPPKSFYSQWESGAQGSFRIAIAAETDEVIDLIVMTEDDFEREAFEE